MATTSDSTRPSATSPKGDDAPRPCAICLKTETHDYRFDHEHLPAKPGQYSAAHALHAEGARIGVVTCLRCGATVTLSMEVDAMGLHDAWHARVG